MINLRHIEVFRAIMTAGSVTNAAQLLHTSQPTISRELARLEYLVGFELFERGRGRLHATARAVVLFQEVELAFIGLDRIVSFAESLSRFSQGAFSVACIPAFSHALLPQVCKHLIANHPGVSVEIATLESPWLEEQLTLQRHDVGLTECPGRRRWRLEGVGVDALGHQAGHFHPCPGDVGHDRGERRHRGHHP